MLLDYLPGSYWLSLNVANALHCGAAVGDVADSCRAARDLLGRGAADSDPDVIEAWVSGWSAVAERLTVAANGRGRLKTRLSSAALMRRAAVHYMIAEWLAPHGHDRKGALFGEMRLSFRRTLEGIQPDATVVDVPYGDTTLDGLFVPASCNGAAPVMIHFNGTHSTLEWPWLTGIVDALAARGIASLAIDHPGSGSARIHKRLVMRHDSEAIAAAAIKHLVGRADVDVERIGVMGGSMGGYHAPRAAAFDARIKACICWGALYRLPDWLTDYATDSSIRPSAPIRDRHMGETLKAIFGAPQGEALADRLRQYSLEGVASRIRCPLYILHGRNDRQVPLEQARRLYDEASGASARTLVQAGPDLGEEHCNLDNLPAAVEVMSDWAADALQAGRERAGHA